MKSSLKSYLLKILFLLLFINPAIHSVDFEKEATLETIKTEGVEAIKLALAKHQTDEDMPISIDIGGETIPTQIVETIDKSEFEITEEVTQIVSSRLGEMYKLPAAEQKELDEHLRSNRQAINVSTGPRSVNQFNKHKAIMDQLRDENRERGQRQEEQAINAIVDKRVRAHSKENEPLFLEKLYKVQRTLISCNHPDPVIRAEARIDLAKLIELNLDPDLFGDVRIIACNLQARYFKNDKLVDISYDKRLPETMWLLFHQEPFYWREKELAKFVGGIKEENVDPGGSFERLYRKVSNQLSVNEKRQNHEYEPQTIWGKGKIFLHDRHKQILRNPENWRLKRAAILCRQGDFDRAYFLADGVTKVKPTMLKVIDFCRQEYCNEAGILKKYEHLPSWQNLSESAKKHIASDVSAQSRMNRQLPEEVVKLQAEAALQEEAELKIEAESEQSEQMNQLRSLHRSYITNRVQAFEKSKKTDFQRAAGYVNWSAIPSEFRQQFDLDNLENKMDATPIQLAVQREFHAIAQETAQVWKAYGNNAYMQELVKRNVTCIKKGVAYNQDGNVIEAAQLADIAWAVLDHSLAVGEGIVQGAKNVAYTFSHPVETAKSIGQLAYTITSLIGHATLEAIDICILGVTNQDAAQKKLKNWEQKFTELTKRAYEYYQEIPNRNITKFISTLATEAFLTGKALHWLKIFLSSARAQAAKIIKQAQNITEASPIAATSEGITSHINQAIEHPKSPSMKGSTVKKTSNTKLKEKALTNQQPLQQIPKFIQDNRVPLDKETILNNSVFKACNARVKGAKVYKKDNLYYHRDTLHTGKAAHLEVYNKRGVHIGEANPITGEIIANTADKTKKIDI